MGAERKTKTFSSKEKSGFSRMVDSQAPARNVTKNRLGAVIFGCKHHTFEECLDKNLFGRFPLGMGLPATHSYVKNITPGLTLFLFNYSDRKLHGIFEAVTEGQMKIDRFAWITSEGAQITPYAAQVRVKEIKKCRPLYEEEFKPIIAKNYYTERFFWFELDKEQTKKLTELFLPSPMPKKMPSLPDASRPNNMFGVLSCSGVDEAAVEEFKNLDSQEDPGMAEMKLDKNAQSYDLAVVSSNVFAPEKRWTDLFKASSTSYAGQDGEGLESQGVRLNSSDCFDMECESASSSYQMSKLPPEACPDAANTEWDSYAVEDETFDNYVREIYESTTTCLQSHDGEDERPDMTDISSSEGRTVLDGERVNIAASQGVCMNINSSLYKSVIAKFMQEIEELKINQLKQRMKIDSLEHELVKSKLQIDELKKWRCHELESASDHCDANQGSVLIVGGYDGCSWLQDLTSYRPSQDQVILLCPMTFSRSYASVAKLNGELYIFGGFHDGVWYDTVESYNPMTNQWIQRPPLNKKKGSLAGASMSEKIFAIGGGNGVDCFSEVEFFDINIGRWIFSQSMLEKRFALAASEMSGAIYVAGGYDGRDYLRSVERFDPRDHAWTKLASMNSRRGCHSLVSFNEKLYAIGGYDGDAMVSTVEVMDPRFGSWVMEEPMTVSRTHFGSFVNGGKIYVVGGMADTQALDVVECYDEICGWQQMTGMTALGKRCFFSTLVM